jgi:hypothetical protein
MPPPTRINRGIDLKNVPNLLDALREHFEVKNDSALARKLAVSPPVVSKLRGGGKLGNTMILRIHERTGWAAEAIRELAK